jgi:hypothetical protein
MLLSEFKEYLSYGELSQLNAGALLTDATQYQRLITSINLGLIELYKRFPIKTSEVVIQLHEEITNYVIHSSNAESQMPIGGDSDAYYVKDSSYYPFRDDILLIVQVFNEDGMEIPLNDENKQYSLFTSSHNSIQHPYPDDDNAITVLYHCIAPKLAVESTDDSVDIDIPQQFTEALLNYVAYRMFASINMNSAEATNYYAKFETSCAMVTNLGLIQKSNTTNMKLEDSGWV